MRTGAGWLLLVLALGAAPSVLAASASVDRTQIAESETLELRIRVDGTGDAQPDLSPLEDDFEVLSNSRNSRISIINGRGDSFTEWAVSLAPRHSGEIEIPALAVGGEHTAPLRVTVTADDAQSAAAPGSQDVMLEVLPDRREVHVQEQLLLTVRLLHAVDLANGATLEEPGVDGAVVRKIGEGSYEKTIGGRRYGVFERRYAVFPQASGELLVPRLRFDASVGGLSLFDRFGGAGRRLRLRSPEQRIRVLPPEPGANPWLPARVLTLVETWDRDPQELRVGESTTRTLTLSADGLTGAQLPALPATAVEGLRFYPDKPQVEDESRDDGITGTRTERSAVIPLRAGQLQLPELRLRWWDTVNARFEEAVVPGRVLQVQPAAGTAAAVPPADAATAPQPAATPDAATASAAVSIADTATLRAWQAACALFAVLALLAGLQWWRAARRTVPGAAPVARESADEAPRYAALRAACLRHDAAALPALLLDWARTVLDGPPPRALAELPARLAVPELDAELRALLASRYAATPAAWDGGALAGIITGARERLLAQRRGAAATALPPLYPQRNAAALRR